MAHILPVLTWPNAQNKVVKSFKYLRIWWLKMKANHPVNEKYIKYFPSPQIHKAVLIFTLVQVRVVLEAHLKILFHSYLLTYSTDVVEYVDM